MRIAILLLIALLPYAAQAHEKKEPRTQAGLGLSPLDRGISLWLIRPKTMVGLELDYLEARWESVLFHRDVDTRPGFVGYSTDDRLHREAVHIRLALTAKRIVSDRVVSHFGYLTCYVEGRQTDWPEDQASLFKNGVEAGWGDCGGLGRRWACCSGRGSPLNS